VTVKLVVAGKTNLWMSDDIKEKILRVPVHGDDAKAILVKLKGFAENGFQGLNDRIVRHEGNLGGGETWRIAYKNSSLLRIVGFFESDNKRDFIALDVFYKDSGDKYSNQQTSRMKEISEIKRAKAWAKG